MSFFPWSEEYSVHLRVIDNDHKDLVDTVNALHDAIKGGSARDKIGQIIGNLARYVDDHFVREEGLMEAYSYPNLAQHKRLHRHLRRTVYATQAVFGKDPMDVDPAKMLRFLRDWLMHHIVEEDKKYVPYLRDNEAAQIVGEEDAGHPAVNDVPDSDDGNTETLTLTVPASKAAALRQCARFLSDGGVEGIGIEDIVMPVSHMTVDEAKHYAKPILRKGS